MGSSGSKGDQGPPSPPPPSSPSTTSPKAKWKPVEIPKFQFRFDTAPANVEADLAWSKAIGCSKAPDGSQGVLFVQLAEGAVVVKGSGSLASEVFATSVARSLGIPGPRMRIVAMRSEEGQAIKGMLQRLEPLLLYMVDMRYVLVMEYLVGFTLKNIDSRTFAQFTAARDNKVTILRQIGALAALDALLNNSDRVPLVAQNAGNPGNLMFSKTSGHVISLDNNIVSLRGNALASYAERVASVLQPICANPGRQAGACLGIAEVIKQYTALAIGDEGMLNIQEGVAQCVVECIKLDMVGLLKTKQTLSHMDENVVGLELIDEEYLEVMLLVFRHVQSSLEALDYAAIRAEAKANIVKRALDAEIQYLPSARDSTTEKAAEESEASDVEQENQEQKDSRTAQEVLTVNQQIGRAVDPITYQECMAIKGYGDAILLTRALLSEAGESKGEVKEEAKNSAKEAKAQGKTLLEISRALVMVERDSKLQRTATAIQTALSDVTQQLHTFLGQSSTVASGAVQLAAGLMARRLLALLTVLQRHSTQKGAAALSAMVSQAVAELEFSYAHLRLACDGNALDSSSVELMQCASDLLQRRLLDFLNAAQLACGHRGKTALRTECQRVFAVGKEASDLLGSLTPLLLSKGHHNQMVIALGKLSSALPAISQATQTSLASSRGSKQALDQLMSALTELDTAAIIVKHCVDCAEPESSQSETAPKRKALILRFRTSSSTNLCAQAETLARSLRH